MAKNNARTTSKFKTPFQASYKTELDVTVEMKADEVKYYKQLIGVIRCYA